MGYLDSIGLDYLWGKIKAMVGGKVDKVEGKGLSANDYTDGEMGKLAAIEDAMYQAPTPTQFRAITPAYSGTGPITEATVGGLLGDEALAGLTASGADDTGSSLYDFVINGVTAGSYTKNAKLAEIVQGINRNKTAGVSAVYSEEEAKFIFTAKQPGPNVNIIIGEGLAAALFDAIEPVDWSAVTFALAYDCFWLTSAATSEAFRFSVVGGSSLVEITITGETSLQDVVTTLNNSPQKMFYIFSCNKYTGQIEVKKKTSGARAELRILDRFNKNVVFDAATAPVADPYVYGQDAIFTAVEVNGTLQPISNQTVSITVPSGVTMDQVNAAIEAASAVPSGAVLMWSGATDAVPDGWALCDGTNDTPDLRGRFVLGAGGIYDAGAAGGSEEVTLTVAQMPEHAHIEQHPDTSHSAFDRWLQSYDTDFNDRSRVGYKDFTIGSDDIGVYAGEGIPTENTGGSQPHPNMPPYYALCYIMKL